MKLQKIFQNIDFEGNMTKIALGFSGSQRLSWNLIRVAPESVRTVSTFITNDCSNEMP